MPEAKRVFMSYSHDSEAHKLWVTALAKFLVEKGVEVLLDQWDLDYGDDLPAFMERAIKETDRVIVICTDKYIEKANSGAGGVGYEKTIVTAEILQDHKNRRRFLPIVRNVVGKQKLPVFFGAAYYLDLSDERDGEQPRMELLKSLFRVPPSKPTLGSSLFLPVLEEGKVAENPKQTDQLPSLAGQDRCAAFEDRFVLAFPGVRGVVWFDDSHVIAERLGILLGEPLRFKEGWLMGWWRGPENLHIGRFGHVEGSHFLMDTDELNIRRIAAVNPGVYYRTFVYVETTPDTPTGIYPATEADIARRVERFGYASEEYGLVDDKLPVSRAEYDDGAAVIGGSPVDIRGRVQLRARYLSPYNFLIAPFLSPINNNKFDRGLQGYLNALLKGREVFKEMCEEIDRLPKRN